MTHKIRLFSLILMTTTVLSNGYAADLGGVSAQSGDIVMRGYLYVPSCELNTLSMNGSAMTPGGDFTLAFTEMSGLRWAKADPDEVLQEERVNIVIKNCTTTQIHVSLLADNPGTSGAVGSYAGKMTYLGDTTAPIVPGTPVSSWQSEEGVSSQNWLYYTVGLGDAKISGAHIDWLPLKKSSTDMQCRASDDCVVKLDGSPYLYSNEWTQTRVLDSENEWQGDWTLAESTLDELVNIDKNGYLPSNLVSALVVTLPLTVRLHHGDSTDNKDTVPLGDYTSKLTVTVSID